MKILLLLFCRMREGTWHRAFPWAVQLARRGHEVTLACTREDVKWRTIEQRMDGVRVLITPSFWEGYYIMSRLTGLYGWAPLSILRRYQELNTGEFDIVHTFEHHPQVSFPLYLWASQKRPAHVADWCDHYGPGGFGAATYSPYRLRVLYNMIGWPLRKWMDYLEFDVRRRADAVTVISTDLARRARQAGVPDERIHLLPGTADIQGIQPRLRDTARHTLGLPMDYDILLFLGGGQFDLDFCLEALARVRERRPDTRLLVVGRKDDAVKRRAAALGLAEQLIQTGWIEDRDLPDCLAAANACLIAMKDNPVNRARWPNKIGSYMAAGRPTVCTQVGDVARLVESRRIGVATEPDPAAFAAGILSLLEDRNCAAEMGRCAREVAEKEFDIHDQMYQLENIYKRAMKKHE